MTDTPKHIHELQLKICLAKSPGERLFQFLKDNNDMRKAIRSAKEKLAMEKNRKDTIRTKT